MQISSVEMEKFIRNELCTLKNPDKEVLHIILRSEIQKIFFQYGGWRPSWIYANYEKVEFEK